jgi:N-acylneuraminate cytidylyltransferase
MVAPKRVLAVVPARGGSVGLPGKNLLPVAGEPLIAHTVRLARAVPEIDRCVVSTDDDTIAHVAARCGAEVPFRRPAELSNDDTPMAPVVRHALAELEAAGEAFDAVVLLMPTTPVRRAADVGAAIRELLRGALDGIVSVSEPPFNPLFVGVRQAAGGLLERFSRAGTGLTRRQDAAPFLRVNGLFYVWRADFVRRLERSWLDEGRHAGFVTDDFSALDVDTADDYRRLCRLVDAGIVSLPIG